MFGCSGGLFREMAGMTFCSPVLAASRCSLRRAQHGWEPGGRFTCSAQRSRWQAGLDWRMPLKEAPSCTAVAEPSRGFCSMALYTQFARNLGIPTCFRLRMM